MSTLYTHYDANIRKTWLLVSVFLIVAMAVGYGLSYYFREPYILIGVSIFAILQAGISYWFSDRIVLKMHNAKHIDPDDKGVNTMTPQERELYRIVENLAITAGLPMPRVYIITDQAANAFATGRDPKHGVVAVTSGLLAILERDELEGVVAHELGHIGNRDMLISTMAVVLVGFVAIASDLFLRSHLYFGGGDRRNSGNAGLILLIVGIALAILGPIFSTLLQLSISRKREYLADATGAILTRYPEGLARALEKIHAHSTPMRTASKSTAHLFIANPFGSKARLSSLFATHPPVAERMRRLRELA